MVLSAAVGEPDGGSVGSAVSAADGSDEGPKEVEEDEGNGAGVRSAPGLLPGEPHPASRTAQTVLVRMPVFLAALRVDLMGNLLVAPDDSPPSEYWAGLRAEL